LIELDFVLRFCVLDGEKVKIRGTSPWKADMDGPVTAVVAGVVLTGGVPASWRRYKLFILPIGLGFQRARRGVKFTFRK
jgi:hypothetical protein